MTFQICTFVVLFFISGRVVQGANLFNWTPSVSLTSNFRVREGLCLDIAGFRNNLQCGGTMQLHTCKTQGSDTQFVFDEDLNQIRSVNYKADCSSTDGDDSDGACVTIDTSGDISVGDTLTLATCDGSDKQYFEHTDDDNILTFNGLCLAKTSDVEPAGNNERTDLSLVDCDNARNRNIEWTIA